MKTTNRLLAVLLSLVLLCSGLPFAFAEDDATIYGSDGNLVWTLDNAGTLTISGSGTMRNYSKTNDNGTYRTSAPWGQYYKTIQTVVLDDSVTSIGNFAFYGCTELESAEIGYSVMRIGGYSFANCSSLINMTIPNSVTEIVDGAFSNCTSLKTVIFGDYDILIDELAFNNCRALESLKLGGGALKINNSKSTFDNCFNLKTIYLTELVAWLNSTDLQSIMSYNGNYVKTIYLNGKLLTEAEIPDGVTQISGFAFYNCKMLTNITIPDSVTSIGDNAFGSSSGSQPLLLCNKDSYAASWAEKNSYPYAFLDGTDEDNIISETVNAKLSYSIDKRTRTLTVFNQGKLISFSSYNAPWRQYQQYVETAILSDGCTSVSEQAFYQCYNLKRVVLPETIEAIDASAFYDCVSLQDITIPDSVTSIGNSAFSNCSSLQNIALPEGLLSIGEYAFQYCSSLQSIVIPDSVTSLGYYYYGRNFANCTSLKSVVIGDGLTQIPYYAFQNCTALETVSIGDNVTNIGYEAFYNCSKLSTVLFGEKVQDIYENAFGGCSSLPAVDLPASVSSIGARAFSDSALKDITIRNKNCSINKDAISIYATIHGYAGSTAEQFADDYGYYFNEITDAAPHDHDRTLVKGYAATCTAAGLTDGWQCSVCGIWFEKQKPIKALGHDYIPVETKEPTETEPGFVRYACTRCDSAYTETLPVTTHTHSFTETERKDASCLEDGYVTYTCATCGYSYTDLLVASGHSFGAWRTFLPVEAGEKGVEIRFCAVCAAYELRESDAVSPGGGTGTPTDPTHTHNFVLVDAKDATCDLAGYNRYMCTCGQSKADILDPLGHIWKLAKVIDPTCEKAGCTDYICGRCGALHQDNYTDPLGHDYQVEQAAPTCTTDGYQVTRCTRCGNMLDDWKTLPALGHVDEDQDGICDRCNIRISNGNLTPEQQNCTHKWNVMDSVAHYLKEAANCQHANIYYFRCSFCKASAGDVPGAENKTFEHGSKNPDVHPADKLVQFGGDDKPICQAPGAAPGIKCTVCGVIVEVPKVYTTIQPHKAAPGKEATCTQNGTCQYCDKQVIAKDPNNHPKDQIVIHEAVAPTCTEKGNTAGAKCSACGTIITAATEIPSLGHDFSEWVVVKEPKSCGEQGERKRYCNRPGCDCVEYEKFTTADHKWVAFDGKNATCTEDGYTPGKKCTVCGAVKDSEVILARGHIVSSQVTIIKEATCEEAGAKGRVCVYCGFAVESVELPALGHDYENGQVVALGDGTHATACNRCQAPGAPSACVDDDNNGSCDICGAQMTGGDHCKYCGQIHDGAFGWLTKFFHSILALFKR